MWVALHASKVRAPNGGDKTGKNPTDRGKKGSQHHVITDAEGLPLAVILTGANRNDVTQAWPLVDAIAPVGGKPRRLRQRPDCACAHRAYDSRALREALRARGILPRSTRRRQAHGSGLSVFRYVAEQVQAWLHGFKRLRTRYERTAFMHQAFLSLACCLICYRHL